MEEQQKQQLSQPEQQEQFEALFSAYLDVCNRAIEKNREVFPYKQIWNVTKNALRDGTIDLVVYDDRPKQRYKVSMDEDGLAVVQKKDETEDDSGWKMTYSYLKHVVDNPKDYIDNPAKIDWDWLRSKVVTLKNSEE